MLSGEPGDKRIARPLAQRFALPRATQIAALNLPVSWNVKEAAG
jgi:hypothetical protein